MIPNLQGRQRWRSQLGRHWKARLRGRRRESHVMEFITGESEGFSQTTHICWVPLYSRHIVEDTAVKKPHPCLNGAYWIPIKISTCLTILHIFKVLLWSHMVDLTVSAESLRKWELETSHWIYLLRSHCWVLADAGIETTLEWFEKWVGGEEMKLANMNLSLKYSWRQLT